MSQVPVHSFGIVTPGNISSCHRDDSGIWWPGADRFAKRIRTDDRCESARRARMGEAIRSQSNHQHADFQSRVGSPEALYFKQLPGRPLPSLQYSAGPCITSSRKTYASYFPSPRYPSLSLTRCSNVDFPQHRWLSGSQDRSTFECI